MNIYFLTYGDKKFYYSKKHLSYLANESGFFNKVISLGPEDLENDFLEKYSKLLSKKEVVDTGYGNTKLFTLY